MKKSIFTVYVPITSQEQADRLKQVCLDNKLRRWRNKDAFIYDKDYFNLFYFNQGDKNFSIGLFTSIMHIEVGYDKTEVTEAEFMELLKQWKDENS